MKGNLVRLDLLSSLRGIPWVLHRQTLQLLVPNSKRLGGYTQRGVLFSKRYTPREDLTERYTVLLKKALGRRLFLLDKT